MFGGETRRGEKKNVKEQSTKGASVSVFLSVCMRNNFMPILGTRAMRLNLNGFIKVTASY